MTPTLTARGARSYQGFITEANHETPDWVVKPSPSQGFPAHSGWLCGSNGCCEHPEVPRCLASCPPSGTIGLVTTSGFLGVSGEYPAAPLRIGVCKVGQ